MNQNPELRLNDDKSVDKVIATGAHVHLKQIFNEHWWLGITVGDEIWHVRLYSDTPITCNVESDDGTVQAGFEEEETVQIDDTSEVEALKDHIKTLKWELSLAHLRGNRLLEALLKKVEESEHA